MRSGIHGTFATLLLLIPVLSIPALAIFGIPQFAPVVASPLDEGPSRDRERRVGQSERPAAESFFSDLDDNTPGPDQNPRSQVGSRPQGKLGDAVPVPRMGRNAPAFTANEPEGHRPFDEPVRNESWADDLGGDNRRNSASSSKQGTIYTPVDRGGYDPRYSAPADPSRMAQEAIPRERPRDLVPAERRLPRKTQSDSLPNSAGLVRPVSNVQEPLTWNSAIRHLNDLEIRNFRLERGHGENQFIFICSYTPADSPRVSRRFEAEADEPLKAVEKVIEQINEWQQRR